ncbi:hypothetical protein HY358_01240 [Candidatus Roizmanbacteria bacterium]|nr:hypothetical protein [Candidatus Roizmanbacteria bacterium]
MSIIGFLVGAITTFHLINLTIVPFIFLFLFSQVRKKNNILFFVFGFLFAFAPLLLFELKHNFVMFTNTFIHKSYEKWVTNTNIPGGLAGKKNILENIVFIGDLMKQYILFSPIVYFAGMLLLYSRKLRGREVLLALFAFGSFLFLAATMRFQFIAHYMFPVAFFLFFATITVLLRTKYIMVLILFLIIGIANFPQHLYEKSQRSAEPFEKAVRYVVDNRIIKKGERFNVIQITKQNLLATIAFEYRFFFNKMGYRPDSEFEYNRSKTLIVFSELPDYNISQFSSWEVDQFGKEYFRSAQKYRNEELTIYKVVK